MAQTKEDGKKYYIVCPDCGYRIVKGGNGTDIEIKCPRCFVALALFIKNGTIILKHNA